MKGRRVVIPHTAQGVARASFDELCNKPLSAADYLAIAQRYHTVILRRHSPAVPGIGRSGQDDSSI